MNPLNVPSSGWVTTTFLAAKTTPPPTGMSLGFASSLGFAALVGVSPGVSPPSAWASPGVSVAPGRHRGPGVVVRVVAARQGSGDTDAAQPGDRTATGQSGGRLRRIAGRRPRAGRSWGLRSIGSVLAVDSALTAGAVISDCEWSLDYRRLLVIVRDDGNFRTVHAPMETSWLKRDDSGRSAEPGARPSRVQRRKHAAGTGRVRHMSRTFGAARRGACFRRPHRLARRRAQRSYIVAPSCQGTNSSWP